MGSMTRRFAVALAAAGLLVSVGCSKDETVTSTSSTTPVTASSSGGGSGTTEPTDDDTTDTTDPEDDRQGLRGRPHRGPLRQRGLVRRCSTRRHWGSSGSGDIAWTIGLRRRPGGRRRDVGGPGRRLRRRWRPTSTPTRAATVDDRVIGPDEALIGPASSRRDCVSRLIGRVGGEGPARPGDPRGRPSSAVSCAHRHARTRAARRSGALAGAITSTRRVHTGRGGSLHGRGIVVAVSGRRVGRHGLRLGSRAAPSAAVVERGVGARPTRWSRGSSSAPEEPVLFIFRDRRTRRWSRVEVQRS